MALRVFAVHSHPDDIEFTMAGTLLRLRDYGCELHYMNIANGCCGTVEHSKEDIIRIRRQESINAAALLGAVFHESICDDICVFYTEKLIRKMTAVVRDVAPDIMLIASPDDYMEDHMNACRLALGAAFSRGLHNYQSIPQRQPVDNDVTIYHASPHGLLDGLRKAVIPDFYVDVSNVMDQKAKMLGCHLSQKNWLDHNQGMDSYIETMKTLTALVGEFSGRFNFAEGWRRHRHLGYSREEITPLEDIFTDSLVYSH